MPSVLGKLLHGLNKGLSDGSVSTGIMYGVINAVMLIPITISFCSIIFRDKAFEQYIPYLVKLVLFSSMIHQLSFARFSSLPFAIGQVQDAGLIFLSAMSGSVALHCQAAKNIVPTTLFVLAICTFLLGCALMVVSKLHLASIIQYLPMPVVGGYLAFIGFFCGQAGLAMMAGVKVDNITEWGALFQDLKTFTLLLPGLGAGVLIYLLLRNVSSPYVLPGCMAGILTIFYSSLFFFGASLADAREFGWIAPLTPSSEFYEAWLLYDVRHVEWGLLPLQAFNWVGMFLVVAFSSSLDVAAIEMELGLPLDYNRELYTVGMSNMLSGLTGGYTGSYIFSQTIFTMRRGVQSRICGVTVALCEGLIILLPFSIPSYMPKLFFGSLLVFIAADLMFEWLVAARDKMMMSEYLVCVLTFIAIQLKGIEVGMGAGLLMAMVAFIVTYAQMQGVNNHSNNSDRSRNRVRNLTSVITGMTRTGQQRVRRRERQTIAPTTLRASSVVRTFDESAILLANRGKIVTISLQGYIFFGSAVKILEELKAHVVITVSGSAGIAANPAPPCASAGGGGGGALSNSFPESAGFTRNKTSSTGDSRQNSDYLALCDERPQTAEKEEGEGLNDSLRVSDLVYEEDMDDFGYRSGHETLQDLFQNSTENDQLLPNSAKKSRNRASFEGNSIFTNSLGAVSQFLQSTAISGLFGSNSSDATNTRAMISSHIAQTEGKGFLSYGSSEKTSGNSIDNEVLGSQNASVRNGGGAFIRPYRVTSISPVEEEGLAAADGAGTAWGSKYNTSNSNGSNGNAAAAGRATLQMVGSRLVVSPNPTRHSPRGNNNSSSSSISLHGPVAATATASEAETGGKRESPTRTRNSSASISPGYSRQQKRQLLDDASDSGGVGSGVGGGRGGTMKDRALDAEQTTTTAVRRTGGEGEGNKGDGATERMIGSLDLDRRHSSRTELTSFRDKFEQEMDGDTLAAIGRRHSSYGSMGNFGELRADDVTTTTRSTAWQGNVLNSKKAEMDCCPVVYDDADRTRHSTDFTGYTRSKSDEPSSTFMHHHNIVGGMNHYNQSSEMVQHQLKQQQQQQQLQQQNARAISLSASPPGYSFLQSIYDMSDADIAKHLQTRNQSSEMPMESSLHSSTHARPLLVASSHKTHPNYAHSVSNNTGNDGFGIANNRPSAPTPSSSTEHHSGFNAEVRRFDVADPSGAGESMVHSANIPFSSMSNHAGSAEANATTTRTTAAGSVGIALSIGSWGNGGLPILLPRSFSRSRSNSHISTRSGSRGSSRGNTFSSEHESLAPPYPPPFPSATPPRVFPPVSEKGSRSRSSEKKPNSGLMSEGLIGSESAHPLSAPGIQGSSINNRTKGSTGFVAGSSNLSAMLQNASNVSNVSSNPRISDIDSRNSCGDGFDGAAADGGFGKSDCAESINGESGAGGGGVGSGWIIGEGSELQSNSGDGKHESLSVPAINAQGLVDHTAADSIHVAKSLDTGYNNQSASAVMGSPGSGGGFGPFRSHSYGRTMRSISEDISFHHPPPTADSQPSYNVSSSGTGNSISHKSAGLSRQQGQFGSSAPRPRRSESAILPENRSPSTTSLLAAVWDNQQLKRKRPFGSNQQLNLFQQQQQQQQSQERRSQLMNSGTSIRPVSSHSDLLNTVSTPPQQGLHYALSNNNSTSMRTSNATALSGTSKSDHKSVRADPLRSAEKSNSNSNTRRREFGERKRNEEEIGEEDGTSMPLKREFSFTETGFQRTDRPLVDGLPALALQPANMPPEFLMSPSRLQQSSSSNNSCSVGGSDNSGSSGNRRESSTEKGRQKTSIAEKKYSVVKKREAGGETQGKESGHYITKSRDSPLQGTLPHQGAGMWPLTASQYRIQHPPLYSTQEHRQQQQQHQQQQQQQQQHRLGYGDVKDSIEAAYTAQERFIASADTVYSHAVPSESTAGNIGGAAGGAGISGVGTERVGSVRVAFSPSSETYGYPEDEEDNDEEEEEEVEDDEIIMTEYLVLDFTNVLGVDATAARSCFLMLVQLMRSANVVVIFANMTPAVEALFVAHGVARKQTSPSSATSSASSAAPRAIGPQENGVDRLRGADDDLEAQQNQRRRNVSVESAVSLPSQPNQELVIVIPELDDALEWCEEQVLYKFLSARGARRAGQPSYEFGSYQQPHQPHFEGTGDPDDDAVITTGMLRDPSYYARAWKQRQRHAARRGGAGSIGSNRSGLLRIADTTDINDSNNLMSSRGSSYNAQLMNSTFRSTDESFDSSTRSPVNARSSSNTAAAAGASAFGNVAPSLSHPNNTDAVSHTLTSLQERSARSLRRILEDYLEIDFRAHATITALLSSPLLTQYFSRERVEESEVVYDIGELADKIYFVETGVVELITFSIDVESALAKEAAAATATSTADTNANTNADAMSVTVSIAGGVHDEFEVCNVQRVSKVSGGGAFGEADFFLARPHSVRAFALADSVLWTLDREHFAHMEVQHPSLCMLIQHALLKSLSLAHTNATFALHPSIMYNHRR